MFPSDLGPFSKKRKLSYRWLSPATSHCAQYTIETQRIKQLTIQFWTWHLSIFSSFISFFFSNLLFSSPLLLLFFFSSFFKDAVLFPQARKQISQIEDEFTLNGNDASYIWLILFVYRLIDKYHNHFCTMQF